MKYCIEYIDNVKIAKYNYSSTHLLLSPLNALMSQDKTYPPQNLPSPKPRTFY